MNAPLKDISISSDDGLEAQIAKAVTPLRAALAAKEQEAARIARWGQERDAAAKKAEVELDRAAQYATRTEHSAIANKLAETEARIRALQQQSQAAIETADGRMGGEVNVLLAEAAAERLLLRQGKDRLEDEIRAEEHRARVAASRPPPPPPQPQPVGDPYEAMIGRLPANQQAWLRAHKEKGYLVPGQGLKPEVLSAFYAAQAAGLDQTSPKFTEHMDRTLGHSDDDASQRFAETSVPAVQPQQRRSPAAAAATAAAPPARVAAGSASGGRSGEGAYLSPAQKQTAERLKMTPTEYYEGIKEAVRRGKLPQSALSGRA